MKLLLKGTIILSVLFFLNKIESVGQPYFDVGGITSWYMPENNSIIPHSEYYIISFVSIPLELGKGNKIILSPFYEHRVINSEPINKSYSFNSLCFPITYLHYFRDSIWSITLTVLPRTNGNAAEINNTAMQYGGVLVNTFKVNSSFKLKFGLYYNKEYFGNFFIPLAGLDWKVNEKLNIFGVLPGSMKLEYKLHKNIYSGIVFKSLTNSYRFNEVDGYFKLKDNHIGVFTDFYLPYNLTIITEVGYSAFRDAKSRGATLLGNLKGDGIIIKAGITYRIRF